MTEVWKSQAKKFCDFCKCWITDNKPSVQFHENGKRHKENVAKKLSTMSKNSIKAQKQSLKMDEEMKKMEEAAMKAYMKDIRDNPDYTSQEIVAEKKRILEERGEKYVESAPVQVAEERVFENTRHFPSPTVGVQPTYKPKGEDGGGKGGGGGGKGGGKGKGGKGKGGGKGSGSAPPPPAPLPQKVWFEAKTDEGHIYYWNSSTGESVWEPPDACYTSLVEQAAILESQKGKEEEVKEKNEELRAWKMREEMKTLRKIKVEDEEKPEKWTPLDVGPAPKAKPYGKWIPVVKTEEKVIDLQLPKQEFIEIRVPSIYERPIKHKEKTINMNHLDINPEIPATFKKRKFNKSNVRSRTDDDD